MEKCGPHPLLTLAERPYLGGSLLVNLTTTTTRQYSNNEKAFNKMFKGIVSNSAKYGLIYYFKLFI